MAVGVVMYVPLVSPVAAAAATLPVMQELSRDTRETVTLSTRIGNERVYIGQVVGPRTVHMEVKIGARWPLYAGASGRAILSFLPQSDREAYLDLVILEPLTPDTIASREELAEEIMRVRKLGYAASAGERDPWAAAVAAPIITRRGRVVEAISVCGPRQRFGPEQVRRCGQAVVRAAKLMADQIG